MDGQQMILKFSDDFDSSLMEEVLKIVENNELINIASSNGQWKTGKVEVQLAKGAQTICFQSGSSANNIKLAWFCFKKR